MFSAQVVAREARFVLLLSAALGEGGVYGPWSAGQCLESSSVLGECLVLLFSAWLRTLSRSSVTGLLVSDVPSGAPAACCAGTSSPVSVDGTT